MQRLKNYIINHKKTVIFLIVLLVIYYFSLPRQLFKESTSTVVTSSNNQLLGAVIADDGQWRFPEIDKVPYKFEQCVLQFEDAYFYKHFGFNPISMGKAMIDNIKSGRVVRGGSTLTQQVIRLSREHKKRTYIEKFIEIILATRLELRYSKKTILNLYASHAPFGSNVVGLEMASWRYYGLQPQQLSWAESATLAVLPNAPSLIYPGKNQLRLKNKRNRLLKKLNDKGIIDTETYILAIEEELPQKPYPLPGIAPHLVQDIAQKYKGQRVQSSIDYYLQQKVNTLVKDHYDRQKQNEIYNLAVLVVDVETRKILAYVGNAPTDEAHQKDVNNVISDRSTGSTLKPLLYAQMFQAGELLPTQMVADVPTEIAGYSPKNFNLTFDGAVPANDALTRSLNIPAVRLLRSYGLHKFRDDLNAYKISGITRSADYYGLSLILGGSEASLWDLCKVYTGYAGIVNHFEQLNHKYYGNEFIDLSYVKSYKTDFGKIKSDYSIIDAGTAYTTLNILTEVNRPGEEQAWEYYNSSQKVAWKTGTSFGNKDAWAIGVTPKYVVGVWIGNSDGEGRPNLTGASSASPLMFDVFDVLPKSDWFLEPYEDLIEADICETSGYLALPICPSVKMRIPKNGVRAKSCPYHSLVQLDKKEQFRVHANCETLDNIVTKTWFQLPPLMAYYYGQSHPDYRSFPDFRSDCTTLEQNTMDFVFPTKVYTKIALTKDVDGELKPLILKLTHTKADVKVFWYMDKSFVGATEDFHELAIKPEKGIHLITVIDEIGNEKKCFLEIE